jgi:ferric-dicitrate binding protein FerR (iron transport regulator)
MLENWMNQNDKNKGKIEMAKQILKSEERNNFNPDTEKALKNILSRLPEQNKLIARKKWSWLQVAAIFMLMIGTTYLAIRFTRDHRIEQITLQQNTLDKAKIQLPDGSFVWVRRGGEVIFPAKFRRKERKIKFKGEGYFEIISDTKHPFIIEAEGTITRVLGTKFTLNTTNKDSIVYLVLEEGKIEFAAAGSGRKEYQKVEPGQQASFNRSNKKLKIQENKNLNYLSWKTKSYVFQNSPIDEIVKSLEEFYNVNFKKLPESLKKETFSTEFDSLYTLEQVLENLEIITETKIEKVGNNYYFIPNS